MAQKAANKKKNTEHFTDSLFHSFCVAVYRISDWSSVIFIWIIEPQSYSHFSFTTIFFLMLRFIKKKTGFSGQVISLRSYVFIAPFFILKTLSTMYNSFLLCCLHFHFTLPTPPLLYIMSQLRNITPQSFCSTAHSFPFTHPIGHPAQLHIIHSAM